MPKRLTQEEIDNFAVASPPAVRELILAIREFILDQVPDADEALKWSQPWYDRNGPVAYIGAFSAHANLGFPRGAELAGRFPMLEGSGKSMRHVKICTVEDLQDPLLAAALLAAAALND